MDSLPDENIDELQENFEDFFNTALCGFLIADAKGIILRGNKTLAGWLGKSEDNLKNMRFADILGTGSKIYYETHLRPLLRMQGYFDEVVLELKSVSGKKMQVLVNAFERRDKDSKPHFIRYTILKASDRLLYEQNLQEAKKLTERELNKEKETVTLRDQLIAVLGHDLRNPLSAVNMAVELMRSSPAGDNSILLSTIKRSNSRMIELVGNIMDFARTRLGGGIVLNRQDVTLEPLLQSIVSEMRLVYPGREITAFFNCESTVNCDADRLSQMFTNLLANGLTHGDAHSPVHLIANSTNGKLEISVTNKGIPIPEALHEKLFAPFTRETGRASKNGLGLGLYICAEIAKAHNGYISFTSTNEGTTFTFIMNT